MSLPLAAVPASMTHRAPCLPRAFVGAPQAYTQICAWATQQGLGDRPFEQVLQRWLAARQERRQQPR